MKDYKTLIAPIVAVIAIVLQLVLKIDLPQQLQSDLVASLANLIAVGAVLYGIIKNHFTQK